MRDRRRARTGPGLSASAATSAEERLRGAQRVLCVGIGGGGDVVGALGVACQAEGLGTPAVIGGLTWERSVVDPLPGPRRLDELEEARPLNDVVALASARTTGPGPFAFAESRMAGVLGEDTVLVDPHAGPRAVAAGLDDACAQLHCDLLVLLDVGGDVLAQGDEPNLGSPLADAVLLATSAFLRVPALLSVVGVGCDGELTVDEVHRGISATAAAGGWLGAWGLTPDATARMDEAVRAVPTEASAMAVRAAQGATGPHPIREGRRTVHLSPAAALVHHLDPALAIAHAAPLAQLVRDCASLEEADALLRERGVPTELAWEQRRAAG